MECSRCRSRHEAHKHKIDSRPDTLRARGHGRETARVIQEGVSRWTFPSRTSSRPALLGPPEGAVQSWSPGNSWNLQIQHSIPDMEGVVSDELRHRIERVLAFPIGRSDGEEHAHENSSTNGQGGVSRSPAGGLLQDYLDQLDPEEEVEEAMEEEEDEDELLFQGSSESDRELEADLIYDSDKEQYTTPYLLFLHHSRTGRRDIRREPEPCPDDLVPPKSPPKRVKDEDEMSSLGRDGAVGRSGHRSSRATSSRTPQTLASGTRDLTDSKSNNREHETTISSGRGSKTVTSAAVRDFSPHAPPSPSKDEEVEGWTEEQLEEDGGDAKVKRDKDEKRRKKRRKKKRKKVKKSKSKGETTEEEEEEREGEKGDQEERKGAKNESPQRRLEALRKSTALVLFRDFAKTVYAPRHSQFQLFSSLEDLVDAPSSPGPTPPAAKGTPSP